MNQTSTNLRRSIAMQKRDLERTLESYLGSASESWHRLPTGHLAAVSFDGATLRLRVTEAINALADRKSPELITETAQGVVLNAKRIAQDTLRAIETAQAVQVGLNQSGIELIRSLRDSAKTASPASAQALAEIVFRLSSVLTKSFGGSRKVLLELQNTNDTLLRPFLTDVAAARLVSPAN